jgi:lipopolysaccharide biosynthesis regulator YciM
VRDSDPELRQLALTTVARVAPKDAVAARLGRSLTARAERERAQAAAAAIGLVERDAQLAVKLLTPLLDDPSHDVRVAMLASLGSAYAAVNSPEQLTNLLQRAEGDAMKRLAAAAAFVMLARTDAGREAATTALNKIGAKGPTMARRTAKLVSAHPAADGIAFEQLVP